MLYPAILVSFIFILALNFGSSIISISKQPVTVIYFLIFFFNCAKNAVMNSHAYCVTKIRFMCMYVKGSFVENTEHLYSRYVEDCLNATCFTFVFCFKFCNF